MKTVKRIVCILLIILVVFAVGYLIFTGSRLPSITTDNEARILNVATNIGGGLCARKT